MKRFTLAALGLVLSGLMLTACNKENPMGTENTPDEQEAISLEKEFGGYTTSDEAPMFNDANVIAESLEDESSNDLMSAADLQFLNAANSPKAYAVRVTWGLLQGDSTATEVVDWSGSAVINKGVLTVLRTIDFERNQGDRLVLPRTNRKEVSFTSQTRPYIDGLVLIIIDKDTSNTAGTLTLTLGSYSRTLNFSELDSAEIVESVGANGHAVSIISHSKAVREFNGGFLAGRWVRKNEKGGEFFGKWINSEGTNAGSVKGVWGTRNNGENVFFGKYISGNGQFSGLLRGTYQFNAERSGGTFEGKWFNRQKQEAGTLQGHFRLGRPNDGKGFFHGRWEKNG